MFGSLNAFRSAKPKKTHPEVEADLFKSVCEQANASLTTPIGLDDPPSVVNLRNIFMQLAHEKFEDAYDYPFDDKLNPPPDQASDSTKCLSKKAFCVIRDNVTDKSTLIENFVDAEILRQQSLPSWMINDAKASLVQKCSDLIKLSTFSDFWSFSPFVKTYARDAAKDKYLNSIRTNAVLLYVNASLKEDDVQASINVLYYMGMYYETISAAKIARDTLFDNVYEHARKLVRGNIPTPSLPLSTEALELIMLLYQSERFVEYFGYDFDGPNSVPPKAFNDNIYRASCLLSYADGDTSSFESEVKARVIRSLPSWIPKDVGTALMSELAACLKSNPYDDGYSWEPKKVDRDQFTCPQKPVVVQNSGFVWCNAFSSERSDVSFSFIFYFGVFYEAPPETSADADDLIHILCNSGQELLSQPKDLPDHPTRNDLKNILLEACDYNFLKIFKFPFKDKETRPKEASAGSPVYAAKVSFNASEIKEDSAAVVVDSIMRLLAFPQWPNESALLVAIRDDLTKQVQTCFNSDTSNAIRLSSPFEMQYNYHSSCAEEVLSTDALFIFSNASSPKSVPVKMHIIHYIGVYYNSPIDGGW